MAKKGFDLVLNDKSFIKGLDKYFTLASKELLSAAFVAAEQLRGDSMDIAPFDKGTAGGLVSTASTTKPKIEGSKVVVSVGYNKKYAVRLHEDMSLTIKQKNTKGKRRSQKYLENPMKENIKEYFEIFAQFLREIR